MELFYGMQTSDFLINRLKEIQERFDGSFNLENLVAKSFEINLWFPLDPLRLHLRLNTGKCK